MKSVGSIEVVVSGVCGDLAEEATMASSGDFESPLEAVNSLDNC